jgi:hypothetical protein
MPAAALIPILLDAAGTALGFGSISAAVGAGVSGIIGAEAATTAILGSVTVGEVATGAIIGAGTGALSAAAQGGNILKGAEFGAVSGGVGAGVSGLLGPALSSANALGSSGLGGAAAQGLTKGLGTLAGGTAGGLAIGENLGSAFKNSLPGALAGGLATGLVSGFGYDGGPIPAGSAGQYGASLLSSGLSPILSNALGVNKSASYPSYSPGFSGTQGTPSTAAQGGTLSSSPGFAYAPGSTIFGSSDKDTKAPSDVWNSTSLRELGSSVT